MTAMTRTDIIKRLESTGEHEFAGGMTEEAVTHAESYFQTVFPEDFREYLLALGSGFVSSEEFMGLGGPDHLNILTTAKHLRKPSSHAAFPENLVPIRGDGFGNYDCIDLNSSDRKQSIVVEWIHDARGNQERKKLADGYWRWFDDMLSMISDLDN